MSLITRIDYFSKYVLNICLSCSLSCLAILFNNLLSHSLFLAPVAVFYLLVFPLCLIWTKLVLFILLYKLQNIHHVHTQTYTHPIWQNFKNIESINKKKVTDKHCSHFSISFHILLYAAPFFGEGNGNPLQYSCLENPMDGGAWWATLVHGVVKSWRRLSNFTFTPFLKEHTVCTLFCNCFFYLTLFHKQLTIPSNALHGVFNANRTVW